MTPVIPQGPPRCARTVLQRPSSTIFSSDKKHGEARYCFLLSPALTPGKEKETMPALRKGCVEPMPTSKGSKFFFLRSFLFLVKVQEYSVPFSLPCKRRYRSCQQKKTDNLLKASFFFSSSKENRVCFETRQQQLGARRGSFLGFLLLDVWILLAFCHSRVNQILEEKEETGSRDGHRARIQGSAGEVSGVPPPPRTIKTLTAGAANDRSHRKTALFEEFR